jgi:hypothetical protein
VSRTCCGSSLTGAVLCFKSCWVLIIQAREKIRWLSYGKPPTTSKWSSGKDNRLVSFTRCGSNPTQVILWLEICRLLITQARENMLRWISYGRLPKTSKWSSGKDNRLVSRTSCGSSLTGAVLCFKSCWVLIIQAREKNKVNKLCQPFNNQQVV